MVSHHSPDPSPLVITAVIPALWSSLPLSYSCGPPPGWSHRCHHQYNRPNRLSDLPSIACVARRWAWREACTAMRRAVPEKADSRSLMCSASCPGSQVRQAMTHAWRLNRKTPGRWAAGTALQASASLLMGRERAMTHAGRLDRQVPGVLRLLGFQRYRRIGETFPTPFTRKAERGGPILVAFILYCANQLTCS